VKQVNHFKNEPPLNRPRTNERRETLDGNPQCSERPRL